MNKEEKPLEKCISFTNNWLKFINTFPFNLFTFEMTWFRLKWNNLISGGFFLFVCLGFFRPTRGIFTHMETSPDVTAANFDLCSVLMAIEQWGFFNVPHLLHISWHTHWFSQCNSSKVSKIIVFSNWIDCVFGFIPLNDHIFFGGVNSY